MNHVMILPPTGLRIFTIQMKPPFTIYISGFTVQWGEGGGHGTADMVPRLWVPPLLFFFPLRGHFIFNIQWSIYSNLSGYWHNFLLHGFKIMYCSLIGFGHWEILLLFVASASRTIPPPCWPISPPPKGGDHSPPLPEIWTVNPVYIYMFILSCIVCPPLNYT